MAANDRLRIRDLAADGALGLTLVAGRDGSSAEVRSAHTSDLRAPGRYILPGELVLTNGLWLGAVEPAAWVAEVADAGAVGIGFGLSAEWPHVPAELIELADARGFALLAVAEDQSFVAVTEAVLARRADGREALLRRQLERHRDLARATSDGLAPAEALRLLERHTGLTGAVVGLAGEVLASTADGVEEALSRAASRAAVRGRLPHAVTDAWTAFGTAQDRARVTLLVPRGVSDVGDEARLFIDQLITAIAFVHERANGEAVARRRLAEDLVTTLRSTRLTPEELQSRLRALGLVPTRDLHVLCAGASADALALAADRAQLQCAVAEAGGFRIVLTQNGRLSASALREALIEIGAEDTALGMAGPARGPDALRAALERARVAYAAARQSPEIGVREDADVTSASVLLSLLEPAALGAYRTAVLGPLLAWDAQHGTDLLRTLEVFLETGGRWQASADRLHVHENTLRYRIDRVGQLTGRDLASTAGRVDLFLALRAPASGLLEEPPSSS